METKTNKIYIQFQPDTWSKKVVEILNDHFFGSKPIADPLLPKDINPWKCVHIAELSTLKDELFSGEVVSLFYSEVMDMTEICSMFVDNRLSVAIYELPNSWFENGVCVCHSDADKGYNGRIVKVTHAKAEDDLSKYHTSIYIDSRAAHLIPAINEMYNIVPLKNGITINYGKYKLPEKCVKAVNSICSVIPPSLRMLYPESDVEAALLFAQEQLAKQ